MNPPTLHATSIALSGNGASLAIATSDGGIAFVDVSPTPTKIFALPGSWAVRKGVMFDDGLILTIDSDESIRLWHQTAPPLQMIRPAPPLLDIHGQTRRAGAVGRSSQGTLVLMQGFA